MASKNMPENNRHSSYSNKINESSFANQREVSHSFEKNAFAYVSPGKED